MNATLLCVALLVPGYGERDVIGRIFNAGGRVLLTGGGELVIMPETTTDADLGELCELRLLVSLRLSDTGVTDKGLQTVSNLRRLESLSLGKTAITDAGLRHLQSLSNLQRLILTGCPNITDEGVARLQKALPMCKVVR
jgi:hypothetical protein